MMATCVEPRIQHSNSFTMKKGDIASKLASHTEQEATSQLFTETFTPQVFIFLCASPSSFISLHAKRHTKRRHSSPFLSEPNSSRTPLKHR